VVFSLLYIGNLESALPVVIPSIPVVSLRIILGKVLLGAHPVKTVVLFHPLIIVTPVIKMLVIVLVCLTIVTVPIPTVINPITIKVSYTDISGIVTTVPMAVKCYTIISCTIVIIMHKWPWCANLEPAGTSPIIIMICTWQVSG
jgi:hypothetical protein